MAVTGPLKTVHYCYKDLGRLVGMGHEILAGPTDRFVGIGTGTILWWTTSRVAANTSRHHCILGARVLDKHCPVLCKSSLWAP